MDRKAMFNLSEEHIQLQQTFREFAENEVKPLAKELDETERFPTETVQKMAEMGMMGLPIPAAITKAIDILKQRAETPEKGKD